MKPFLTLLFATVLSCFFTVNAQDKEILVLIDTDMGKIKVKLYNETPLHRDNFVKHITDKMYDGLIFHRVIKQFMIQAGDVTSKDAPIDQELGSNDLSYTIPAEFIYPKYFHKSGALCAARSSDDENPEKASSATQFYIVTGKFYTDMELTKMEEKENIQLSPEQRETYMHKGGSPHLDGNYTVFGEVINGMKVVDKIQFVNTNEKDRPLKNVKIKSIKVVEK